MYALSKVDGECLFCNVNIIFDMVLIGPVLMLITWRVNMEEFSPTENQDIKSTEKKNGDHCSNIFLSMEKPLSSLLRKVLTFICYGPGVLGVLWLIGRFFRR